MSEITRMNRYAAKLNPERSFDSPQALSEQVGLTRGEKLSALRRWRNQVQDRLDAAAEGMAPDPPLTEVEGRRFDPVEGDAELLRKIELQLDCLENGNR